MDEAETWAGQVQALYAGPPAEFVARRTALDRRVRKSGDRDGADAVSALRKPTAAADTLNRVVHAAHPVVADLVLLGSRLRQAQSALDARELAALRGQRDALIEAWVLAAQELGEGQTAALQTQLRDTVIAALADEKAQEALCSGVLTRALSYSGFGEVDVSDAVARTSTGVLLTRLDGGRSDDATEPKPEQKVDREPAVSEADVAAARAGIEEAERQRARCREEVAQADRLLTQAQRRSEAAQTAYERAVQRLEELTGQASAPG
ncbi:MAG: hypothetical protein ACR2FV_15085 [Ornithinimicrobium sp.]|uniref:hypothetical protein n=1 Tax=Ornithinimicrobium sp. TaxID=1977084 RepID=UPI003D9BF70B